MTSTIVKTILLKAKSDPKFATLIVKDPLTALRTYKLTRVDYDTVVKTVKTFEVKGIWPADF